MNANQPNIKPLEPVSFDDLEPEVLEVPAELPTPEGGSLKDRIMAQAKKEEAEVAAVEAAKEQVMVDKPVVAPVQPAAVPPQPETAPAVPVAAPETPARTEAVPAEAPAPVPELPPVPEAKPEAAEAAPTETEQPQPSKAQTPALPVTPPVPAPVQVNAEKTETRKQIESILQEGLAPMFLQMDQQERQVFTAAANETASKLEVLVTQFKASAKEVLRLIRTWLTKIPKVNKYFLEQASKIKTDEILLIQTQKKKESRLLH